MIVSHRLVLRYTLSCHFIIKRLARSGELLSCIRLKPWHLQGSDQVFGIVDYFNSFHYRSKMMYDSGNSFKDI